jgi:hypothetical protein
LHITVRTCYYWLHIEKEDTMQNALQAEAAAAVPVARALMRRRKADAPAAGWPREPAQSATR